MYVCMCCMYSYACMYVCMYLCMCVYAYVVSTRMYVCMHYVYVYVCMCVCVCVRMYVSLSIYACLCMYVCIYMRLYACNVAERSLILKFSSQNINFILLDYTIFQLTTSSV